MYISHVMLTLLSLAAEIGQYLRIVFFLLFLTHHHHHHHVVLLARISLTLYRNVFLSIIASDRSSGLLSKSDKPDMQDTAGEARTSS